MVKKFFKVEISSSFITFKIEDGMLTSINYSTSEKKINKNVIQGRLVEVKRNDSNFYDEIYELLNRIFEYNRVAFNELYKFFESTNDIEFMEIIKFATK